MSGLVTFFEGSQDSDFGTDLLSQAAKAFLKGEEKGEILIFPLIETCSSLPLDSPEDLCHYYHLLCAILWMRDKDNPRFNQAIYPLLQRGKSEGFWKSFQLEQGYRTLATFLYDGTCEPFEVKQLEKGAVLQENEMHTLERQVPEPRENAELALICLYLGWKWGKEELIQYGLKLTEFCLSLCDHEGKLFQGMWVRESDYQKGGLTQIFSLLFTVASHVALSSKVQVVSDALCEQKKGMDPLTSLFAKAFHTLIEEEVPLPKMEGGIMLYDQDQSLGFLRYHKGDLSFACSASGVNTGLGVMHKKGIHITSFGPHYAPLADSNCYGLFRPSNGSREGFRDLTYESKEDKVGIKGWTRVVAPVNDHVSKQSYSLAQGGPEWLYFEVVGEEEEMKVTVRQTRYQPETPLYFVFFVSAEKGIIEGKAELFPRGLERFQGPIDQIFFEKEGKRIKVKAHFEGEMEVIPLAGDDHFWSADFLLAFPLQRKMTAYRWSIQ